MKAKTEIKFTPKTITEAMLSEYQSINEVMKGLEKRREDLRSSILYAYPEGGSVGDFNIYIEHQNRRSFPIDDVKAQVEESAWKQFFEPFIRISDVTKLSVRKHSEDNLT